MTTEHQIRGRTAGFPPAVTECRQFSKRGVSVFVRQSEKQVYIYMICA